MTPDLYAAWLNAGDRLQPAGDFAIDFVLTVGPGLSLALVLWLGLWAWDKTAPRIAARRARRRGLRQLESYANHPASRSRKEKP